MPLTAIVAQAENGAIGCGNALLWHLPKDMARFREVTRGRPVLMGRNTWMSLPDKYRPLPGRENNVLSHLYGQPDPALDPYAGRVRVYGELGSALQDLELRHRGEEVMVMGGARLYEATLHRVTRLHLTTVHESPDGDAFFPELNRGEWNLRFLEQGVDNGHLFTYEILERKA